MTELRFPARGAGGEPIDLPRTFHSHGVAGLPPMRSAEDASWFEVTLSLPRGRPRTVTARPERKDVVVDVTGREPGKQTLDAIERELRHVLRMDDDLSGFYDQLEADPDLAWVCAGAGRMVRSQSVFEEVVKTICTTNCAWSATVRMVSRLVEHLGQPAVGAPAQGPWGRAFPTPAALADADEEFYREEVRAGYRGAYIKRLATDVAAGDLDLEVLGERDNGLSDDQVEEHLLSLPGVGPYAAAHTMMMLGRHSRLILDSWTRPKYARLVGKKKVADATILRRFRRYGEHAGLAFWLFVTSDWIPRDP